MRRKLPHAVALRLCWALPFATMIAVAWLDAGLSAWLQGVIYLLAAMLLALGFVALSRFIYFRSRASYRQGIYHVIAGGVFAIYAHFRIQEHRIRVIQEAEQLTPVIDAVKHYQVWAKHLPTNVDQLGDLPPHLPRFNYQPSQDETFHITFRHNVVIAHDFDSVTERWQDKFIAP